MKFKKRLSIGPLLKNPGTPDGQQFSQVAMRVCPGARVCSCVCARVWGAQKKYLLWGLSP